MNPVVRWSRLAATLLMAVWGWAILQEPNPSIVHLLTLPIHETGHIVFMPFGELMTAAGGSLFQLIFPAIFVGYFIYHGDKQAATYPLWFVGASAADLVPYIQDASRGELELIGGEHDWSYILSELTLVHRDHEIGQAVLAFGALCMFAALILGFLWLPPKEST